MDKENFLKKVLYPVVRVSASKGTGSGTVLWSGKVGKKFETYILTNHHVVASSLKLSEKYDSFVGQNMPQETRSKVDVEFFRYPKGSRLEGTFAIPADIVAYSEQLDLALLQLRSESEAEYVALLPDVDLEDELCLGDEVYAVGAALAHAPIMTHGRINGMSDEIDDNPYWLSDAQIIFGNSGGAVFLGEGSIFLGVPSRVALAQIGWSASAVTHLGWFIPYMTIYRFLEMNFYTFIYDAQEDAQDCHEEREIAQDQMQRMADLVLVKTRRAHKGKVATQYFSEVIDEDDTQ